MAVVLRAFDLSGGLRVGITTQSGSPFFVVAVFLIFSLAPAFSRAVSPAQESGQPSFEELAKSATAARETGNTEEAIRDYQRAVNAHGDWEEGWWFLGILHYDANHFSEAVLSLKRVVQLNPRLGPAWNLLGLCEFETHDYRNALEHLQMGQELGIGDDAEIAPVSKYHLALLLNRNGEFEKAFSTLSSTFAGQKPAQVKVALGLSLLRIPLLPQEVDPSQDALIQAAGETASILAQGEPASRIDSFQALLKQYPSAPYLHYGFGILLASAGRNDEALAQERQELKISPESVLPYIEISFLELRSHHPNNALAAAQTAVRLAPDLSTAHKALAQSLQALGQKEKSAAELRAAESLPEKQVRETRTIQMYGYQSAAGLQAATGTTPDEPANLDELSHQAAAAQAAGNSDHAIRIYKQALQMHPEWSEGWWNLGMLSYSAGRYREAITALKVCVERLPDIGTAWAVMGLSEFEIKDYDNALIHLQRGQDLGMGGSAESVQLARYRLAILLNRNGEFAKATELLAGEGGSGTLAKQVQFALGMALLRMPLFPEQVEASKNKLVMSAGEIAALFQESKYDEALPKMQELLRHNSTAPFLHYDYGTALAALSQYDEAESQLRQELLISPTSELPYAELASIALKTRRPADALSLAQRGVQLAPNSAEAHYLLGRSYLELGQEQRAVQELESASKMAPGSPEVHFNLAKAYAKTNQPEKAEEERDIFTRLNTRAEQQRSQGGNQSYSGPRGQADFSVPAQTTRVPGSDAR